MLALLVSASLSSPLSQQQHLPYYHCHHFHKFHIVSELYHIPERSAEIFKTFNPFKHGDANGYTSRHLRPCWSNPSFLIFDVGLSGARCSGLSTIVPECQKLKTMGMQYGPEVLNVLVHSFCHSQ